MQDSFIQTSFGEWLLTHVESPRRCLHALAHSELNHTEIMMTTISSAQVHTTPSSVYQFNYGLLTSLKYEAISSWYSRDWNDCKLQSNDLSLIYP